MTIDRDWSKTWTSAAAAIHGAVSYTDKNQLTLTDVMGFTGHAFRMNIDPESINAAGPTSFPGGYILRRNLCNLGFTSCLADPSAPLTPDKVERTIALVQQSIDRGVPAIAFDLFTPEFGLIYGYDDDKQQFHAKDHAKDGTLTYAQFADPKIDLLFVTTISESLPHSKYEMLRMALSMIVDHARGKEWTHVFGNKFAQGLAGYEAWINVMKLRRADEHGNAFNLLVIGDAREFAARFLREIAFRWDGSNVVERTVRKHAGDAAVHYKAVAAAFGQLRERFPFPDGGHPKDPNTADQAIQLLQHAQEAETKGVEQLEQLFHFMGEYHSEIWVH
ncbi:hypothetical protein [Paenibacillus sp. Soil522]|uniref:hypothetical protein n=1 Tax=Paenibacillus sp. Soil522 TaxID=1736388 RepID=UPI0006FB04ED|nr:hypothetical protein [Paenibacillus sp. Soil522]KRE49363.1 hypothetical protein ASG81_05295 [Paenibacillus sp. Soil522]